VDGLLGELVGAGEVVAVDDLVGEGHGHRQVESRPGFGDLRVAAPGAGPTAGTALAPDLVEAGLVDRPAQQRRGGLRAAVGAGLQDADDAVHGDVLGREAVSSDGVGEPRRREALGRSQHGVEATWP
jgi:hypothetical protein